MVKIRLEKVGRVVRCTPVGDVSFADMSNASYLISQKYGHLRPVRILVDVRHVKIIMTPRESQQFAQFVSGLPGFDEARIAVLHGMSHNPMAATDRESRASGLLVRSFFCETESYSWLTIRPKNGNCIKIAGGHI